MRKFFTPALSSSEWTHADTLADTHTHTHTHEREYSHSHEHSDANSRGVRPQVFLAALMCMKQRGSCLHEFIYEATWFSCVLYDMLPSVDLLVFFMTSEVSLTEGKNGRSREQQSKQDRWRHRQFSSVTDWPTSAAKHILDMFKKKKQTVRKEIRQTI